MKMGKVGWRNTKLWKYVCWFSSPLQWKTSIRCLLYVAFSRADYLIILKLHSAPLAALPKILVEDKVLVYDIFSSSLDIMEGKMQMCILEIQKECCYQWFGRGKGFGL